MINCLESQTYASLYCRYDPESDNRNWTELIQNQQVESIDLLVAQKAVKAEETGREIQQIIYFGSPHSQQLKDLDERLDYSFKIAALALFPHLINSQQQNLLLFALRFLKTRLNEDVLSQLLDASNSPRNSKQIVSNFDSLIELINGSSEDV